MVAVFIGFAHFFMKTKQNNSDKKVLIPMCQRILKRHDQRLLALIYVGLRHICGFTHQPAVPCGNTQYTV